jgi:kinetochore protein Spc25, fungi type
MAVRFPRIDLETLLKSNKDTTPTIDLKLEGYERATKGFLKAVERYKHRSLAGLSERKQKQNDELKKLEEKTREAQNETNQFRLQEIELMKGEFAFQPDWR